MKLGDLYYIKPIVRKRKHIWRKDGLLYSSMRHIPVFESCEIVQILKNKVRVGYMADIDGWNFVFVYLTTNDLILHSELRKYKCIYLINVL